MERGYRTKLIRIFTVLGGLYFFLEFVLPASFLKATGVTAAHGQISLGFMAIGLLAFGLGLINLLLSHGRRIAFLRKGWGDSLALLGGLFVMLAVTIWDWSVDLRAERSAGTLAILAEFSQRIVDDERAQVKGVPAAAFRREKLVLATEAELARIESRNERLLAEDSPTRPTRASYIGEFQPLLAAVRNETAALQRTLTVQASAHYELTRDLNGLAAAERRLGRFEAEHGLPKRLFSVLFDGFFVSLGSAMFSLLGVYIAAAAYRAFRIRSWESSLMMLAAVTVMLGQTPFAGEIFWGVLPEWRTWLLEVPNSAAFRAIRIGASIAGLILAFRMWFSIESESFVESAK